MFCDGHCHLTLIPDGELAGVIERARTAGIDRFIQGGISPEDWQKQRVLAARFPGAVLSTFGLHPWWVNEHHADSPRIAEALGELELALGDAIGVGELGLDHGPRTAPESRAVQLKVFGAQLEIATTKRKPLVLHVVHAHAEALAALEGHRGRLSGGIVHSFSEGPEIARRYLDLGLTLSVGAALVRPGYKRLKEAWKVLPEAAWTLETDAPDQLLEPANLWDVARQGAQLRGGTTPEALLALSRDQLVKIFAL